MPTEDESSCPKQFNIYYSVGLVTVLVEWLAGNYHFFVFVL